MKPVVYDMNHALEMLAAVKHWRVQCENSATKGRSHSCTIWNGGRRVTAHARTPMDAVRAAFAKLADKATGTGLKIVRWDR